MSDLISRMGLLEDLGASCYDLSALTGVTGDERTLQEAIMQYPAIDAVKVAHAHWIGLEYDGYADGFPVFDSWVCSECGEEFHSEGEPPAFNYCPDCGAKMDEEEN